MERKEIMHFNSLSYAIVIPLSFDPLAFECLPDAENNGCTSIKRDVLEIETSSMAMFHYCFRPCSLMKSFQLNGSPLLNLGEQAIVKRFELTQEQRSKVGIHKNENCQYWLAKEKIRFRIKKIKVWFLRWGNAFVTVEISQDGLNEAEVLDLTAQLSSLQRKSSIAYEQATGKEQRTVRTFTVAELVKNLIALQTYVPLKPYLNETFQKAYGMFCGILSKEDPAGCGVFLEMLRQQRRSNMRTGAGVADHHLYSPFEYIHWAVGERMMAAIGDVHKGGAENTHFLKDRGGLRKTVLENYLLVYLYCLGLHLHSKMLISEYDSTIKNASLQNGYEMTQKMMAVNNIQLEGLTGEMHINLLFEEYLCNRVWQLQKSLEKLDKEYLPSLIKYKPCDVFISYRRRGGFYPARLLFTLLEAKKKKPFLDVERLRSGRFDEHIYAVIERSDAVLFILTEGCFDRCKDEEDWLRREIVKALEVKKSRNIKVIPVLIDDFQFPSDIPPELDLSKENAIRFSPESFKGDFEKLCNFLDDDVF